MNQDEILLGLEQTLIGYFYNRTQNLDLSRDLYQDLWVKVREQQEKGSVSFENAGKFRGWIFRMAGTMVVDHFRKRRRSLHKYSKEELEHQLQSQSAHIGSKLRRDPEPSVEDLIVHQDLLDRISALVKDLPEEWRFVYEMHVLGGMKHREICLITGRSLNTVLGQMRYIRKRLIKEIKL